MTTKKNTEYIQNTENTNERSVSFVDNDIFNNEKKIYIFEKPKFKHIESIRYRTYEGNDRTVDVLGIHIDGDMKSMVGSCWLHYWVPAHEALHFYAQYHLGVSRKINATHQVEYAYLKWADEEDMPKDVTIEWKLAEFITRYCGIPYKFLPEIMQVDDALGSE